MTIHNALLFHLSLSKPRFTNNIKKYHKNKTKLFAVFLQSFFCETVIPIVVDVCVHTSHTFYVRLGSCTSSYHVNAIILCRRWASRRKGSRRTARSNSPAKGSWTRVSTPPRSPAAWTRSPRRRPTTQRIRSWPNPPPPPRTRSRRPSETWPGTSPRHTGPRVDVHLSRTTVNERLRVDHTRARAHSHTDTIWAIKPLIA